MFRGSWRQNRALMMGIPSERARAYSTDSSDSPMMIPGFRAQYSLKREGSSTFRVKQATPSLSPKTDLVWDSKCRDICSVPVTHRSRLEFSWYPLSILLSFLSKGVINPH